MRRINSVLIVFTSALLLMAGSASAELLDQSFRGSNDIAPQASEQPGTLVAAETEKKTDPAPSPDVQERAVPRDPRELPGTFTLPQKAPPPVAQPSPKVMIPMPPSSAPSSGPTGPLPIVGGTFEPDYRYPWVVRMSGCSGVLIDPQWVLTAAHCVTPGIGFGNLTYSRTDPHTGAVQTETRAPFSEQRPNPGVHIHPMYDPNNNFANDIALIKLAQPFTINPYLQTVGLPRIPRSQGVVGTVASISHTQPLPPGQFAIFRAPIPLVDYAPKIYIPAIAASASLCPGDSGSGFVTVENGRAMARGVASQGTITSCMTPSGEAVFTDVFTFRDWILQTMGMNDASLVGNTRVRWSGRGARGVMGVGCVNPYGTLWGPLNVVGVEEGTVCEAGQTQTVMCNLDKVQDSGGAMAPTLAGLTMRTTMANGASEVHSLPFSGNTASFFGMFPAGVVSREFTCQIGTPNMMPLTQGNMSIMQRGVEGEQPAEPTPSVPGPTEQPSGTKPQ